MGEWREHQSSLKRNGQDVCVMKLKATGVVTLPPAESSRLLTAVGGLGNLERT